MEFTPTVIITVLGAIASICTIIGFIVKMIDRRKAKHIKK